MFKGSIIVSIVLGALVGAGTASQVMTGTTLREPYSLEPEVQLNVRPMKFVEAPKPKPVVAKSVKPVSTKKRTVRKRSYKKRRPAPRMTREEASIASLVRSGMSGG